jgi:hypothetical protein
MPLPDRGGILDQDWELLWAIAIIEDQYAQEQELKKNFEQKRGELEAIRQRLLQER